MIIEISSLKIIQDIQADFSSRFPYLKIEFFKTPHDWEEVNSDIPCSPDQTIGEVRNRHILGIINIDPGRETGAIEQEFRRRFDLNVQIYRLQLGRWIQTAGTDILTLIEQNEIGRDASQSDT